MAPGARSKFGAPIFDFEVFTGSKYIVLQKVLVTLLGLFRVPQSHSALPVVIRRSGNCALVGPPPSLRPCHVHKRNLKIRWCPKCHLGNSRFRSSKSSNAVILALTATNSFIPTTRNGQFFEQSGQKT